MKLTILHTNDFHGNLTSERQAMLAELRPQADLYFDCGDCIKTGNLGIPLSADPCWERLEALWVTASVLGNRETHPLRNVFELKTQGVKHDILVANMVRPSGTPVFPRHKIYEVEGVKVGVFGVMLAMATEKMRTASAWSYRWSQPIPTALEVARELRSQVDVVIALTHIGHANDVKLAEASPDIDIILGGHSHTVIEHPEPVNGTWICQAGSHGRYAGLYEWDGSALAGELKPLS